MPNASEGPIVVFDNSVPALNLAFAQILERLDRSRGLRGATAIYDRTEVGGPVQDTEAVRLMDLPSEHPSSPLFWLLTMPMSDTDPEIQQLLAQLWPWLLLAVQMLRRMPPGRLTDNTAGTADDTLAAVPDPADAPGTADILRDDLVANLLPVLRNNLADLTAKVNLLIETMG